MKIPPLVLAALSSVLLLGAASSFAEEATDASEISVLLAKAKTVATQVTKLNAAIKEQEPQMKIDVKQVKEELDPMWDRVQAEKKALVSLLADTNAACTGTYSKEEYPAALARCKEAQKVYRQKETEFNNDAETYNKLDAPVHARLQTYSDEMEALKNANAELGQLRAVMRTKITTQCVAKCAVDRSCFDACYDNTAQRANAVLFPLIGMGISPNP